MSANSERAKLIEEFRAWKNNIFNVTRQIVDQREFAAGKEHLAKTLRDMPIRDFDFVLGLGIGDEKADIQRSISELFNAIEHDHGTIDQIVGLGIDISDHEQLGDAKHGFTQGVDVSLYNRNVYDFLVKSDEDIGLQYAATASKWQGGFDQVGVAEIDGMHEVLAFKRSIVRGDHSRYGFVVQDAGTASEKVGRDAAPYTETIFNALVAVEFHRFIYELVPQLTLPHDMVVVAGNHDMIYVPHTHYRVKGSPDWKGRPAPKPEIPEMVDDTYRRLAEMGRFARGLGIVTGSGPKVFGRRGNKP